MTTVQISVGTRGCAARQAKREDRPALWAEAGLAVTRAGGEDTGYAITHIASGYAVMARIRLLRDARAIAQRMLDAGDWTQSRTGVLRDRRLRMRALNIRDEARMLGLAGS